MQLGDKILTGNSAILFTKIVVEDIFGDSIKLIDEQIALDHQGWFLVTYEYLSQEYFILIEGEMNSFNIRIINKDGGFMALMNLMHYENNLTKKDISYAIEKMRDELDSSINFYKVIDDKLYQQVNVHYKRIKRR